MKIAYFNIQFSWELAIKHAKTIVWNYRNPNSLMINSSSLSICDSFTSLFALHAEIWNTLLPDSFIIELYYGVGKYLYSSFVLFSVNLSVNFLNTFFQFIGNLPAYPPTSSKRKPKCEETGIISERKDNIYEVCLRKSRIDSQLKSTEISLNECFVHVRGQFLNSMLCESSSWFQGAQLTIVNFCECSCRQWLVFFRPMILAFGSLAIACALTFCVLEIFACLLKRDQRHRKGRLFAQLMVRERAKRDFLELAQCPSTFMT